jgi:hypothetical protein
MRKTNTKTSLNITMNVDGGASVYMKWSDLDVDHKKECSERIINRLIKIPEYEWLIPLVEGYLNEKYCHKCLYLPLDDKYIDSQEDCNSRQSAFCFPYCFKERVIQIVTNCEDK